MAGRAPSRAGANATTDGTRFRPSSPGMTTGFSPCIKATRELVVPRSIPTTRSSAISLRLSQGLLYIAHQVQQVTASLQQGSHSFLAGRLPSVVLLIQGLIPVCPAIPHLLVERVQLG